MSSFKSSGDIQKKEGGLDSCFVKDALTIISGSHARLPQMASLQEREKSYITRSAAVWHL